MAERRTTREIRIKRAYEPASMDDGVWVLADRLWPRGVSKERAKLDGWEKELAPSTALRRWFGHDPAKWGEFRRRYREELRAPERREALARLAVLAEHGTVTLIYGARDTEHNEAVVLAEMLRGGSDES